jgi:hypothetical protein
MLLTSNHLPFTPVGLNPDGDFGFLLCKEAIQVAHKMSVVLLRCHVKVKLYTILTLHPSYLHNECSDPLVTLTTNLETKSFMTCYFSQTFKFFLMKLRNISGKISTGVQKPKTIKVENVT